MRCPFSLRSQTGLVRSGPLALLVLVPLVSLHRILHGYLIFVMTGRCQCWLGNFRAHLICLDDRIVLVSLAQLAHRCFLQQA